MTTDPREAYTVVHVCQVWLPQTQTWLYGLVRHLPDHVASEVVAAQVRNLGQFPIGRLHTRHGSPGLLGRALRRITRAPDVGPVSSVVAAARPSIVHAHFGPVGWVVRDVARRVDSALVVSFYGLDVDYAPTVDHRWRARYRELFSAADRVLCLGPDMAGRLEGRGCPSRKLRIHHLGIDTDAIPYAPHPWTPDRPMRCLVAASFREKKGIPDAIEALGRVAATTRVELTIVGDADEEPRSQAEKTRIHTAIEANPGVRVTLLGYRPHSEVLRLARNHDVFLAPSRTASDGDREGTPMTILEMMAAGLPVVSTTHADIPELIEDGRTGLLAREGNLDDLVDRIRWLVDHPEDRLPMATTARSHVEQRFSSAVQGRELAAVYDVVRAGR